MKLYVGKVRYEHLPIELKNEIEELKKQIVDLVGHVGVLEQEVMKLKTCSK